MTMRWFRLLVPAIAALIGLSTLDAYAAGLVQLSSDPFTNNTSQHRTEVEPDTFAFGSTIVSAFQVGRFFNGGASDIGFATSNNGGKTFTSGFLPDTTVQSVPANLKYQRVSDPSVAFDAKHNVWMISYLGIPAALVPVDVLASLSSDGGLTWGAPVVITADGQFNDKNWTVCDNTASSPHYGNCYTEFDDASLSDLEQMSTSSDGGLTWGAALETGQHLHGIGGQPLVQPDGTVIVPVGGFATRGGVINAFSSTDGGESWGKTTRIANVTAHLVAGGLRNGLGLPTAEIDASGKVYVVWPDCRFEPGCTANDLVLSTSTDGTNWSPVTRIPLDPIGSGVDHFIPGLAVNNATSGAGAQLALAFYFYPNASCTAATCQLEVGSSTSADGGGSWTLNQQVAGPMKLSWLANTSQGRMVGDYISTSFVTGPAFPAFAVANAPSGSVFDEAMYTVRGGLSVGGPGNRAHDQLTIPSNGPDTGSNQTDQ
jgi:hypothetical protein